MGLDHHIVMDPLTVGDITTLLERVERVCRRRGIPASVLFDVKLALEEICMNVLQHGYGEGTPGPIEVDLCLRDEEIVLEIRDKAPFFNPASVEAPDLDSGWEDRQPGGLGWHLVGQVMDEVAHKPNPSGGNRFRLAKRLVREGSGSEER